MVRKHSDRIISNRIPQIWVVKIADFTSVTIHLAKAGSTSISLHVEHAEMPIIWRFAAIWCHIFQSSCQKFYYE